MPRILKQSVVAVLALATSALVQAQSGAFELPQGSTLNVLTVMVGADASPLWLEVGVPSAIRFAYPHVQACYVPTKLMHDDVSHRLLVTAKSIRCTDAKGVTMLKVPLQAHLVDAGGESGLALHADAQADVPYLAEGTRLKLDEQLSVQPAQSSPDSE
jgi:hypothetical protein